MSESTDPWSAASVHYSTLGERERLEYWSQLTAEQQTALVSALGRPTPSPALEEPPPSRKRSLLSVLGVGCLGYVLGVVLTIGGQVVLVYLGVQGAKKFANEVMYGGHDPDLDYLSSDCSGTPASREEELFCRQVLHIQRQDEESRRGEP